MARSTVKITLDQVFLNSFRKEALRFGLSVPSWIRSICIRSLVEGSRAAVEDSSPPSTPPTDPDATPPCTPDQHILLETEHYRRGYDTCMLELVKQGRVKPKSA